MFRLEGGKIAEHWDPESYQSSDVHLFQRRRFTKRAKFTRIRNLII